MELGADVEYALKAALEIATHERDPKPVTDKVICRAQNLPVKWGSQ